MTRAARKELMTDIKIPLVRDTISVGEIDKLIDWLKTNPRLTKGTLTVEFERRWSEWQGKKFSVFVNSGSSANLAMAYSLLLSKRLKNKKIIVPAVSWVTTVSPFVQFGFEPIVCECDHETLGLDIDHLRQLVKEHNPGSLIIVHVLGFPNKMREITEICRENDIELLEDSCESVGSLYNGVKTGNFGLMSSFSFYYGHHLSTIEGGMVSTDDEKLYHLLIALRSHGWDRDLPETERNSLRRHYGIDDFRALYTFYYPGFNLRATDLQAFIGLQQMEKIEHVARKRNENFKLYQSLVKNDFWKICDFDHAFVSNFCYPIITKNIKSVVEKMSENGVEIRPLVCGSITRHPFWFERYGKQSLAFADTVHDFGLYLPNNHELKLEEIERVAEIINPLL